MKKLLDHLVLFLAEGNRPLRILLFGGVFLAWLIMTLLAKLFGIDTDIDSEVGLANIILIIVSILAGFGIAFMIFAYLDDVQKDDDDGQPD